MNYYAAQAKEQLEKRVIECDTLCKAWCNVKRVYKKDGGDFANLAKNFENAYFTNAECYNNGEKEIKISATNNNRYFYDSMPTYRTIEANEEKLYKDRLVQRGAYLKPFIVLTPDEIMEAIEKRATYYAIECEKLKLTLKDFDKIAEELTALREKANATARKYGSYSEYILRSIFLENRL